LQFVVRIFLPVITWVSARLLAKAQQRCQEHAEQGSVLHLGARASVTC
jgi:hypothetical protein